MSLPRTRSLGSWKDSSVCFVNNSRGRERLARLCVVVTRGNPGNKLGTGVDLVVRCLLLERDLVVGPLLSLGWKETGVD